MTYAAQRRRQSSRNPIAVGAVAALAGLIFAANAQLAQGTGNVRQPQDLADLVRLETDRVDRLQLTATDLQSQITDLTWAGAAQLPVESAVDLRREAVAVGTVPVAGPGITVVLDDAPASAINIPGVTPDDLVIHQQDLQDVIAALWAGGAEAMTLMGERVTMTSAFRCTGNVLLLHGRVFSPPYVVQAIGDPAQLQAAVDASPGIAIFRTYVDWLGLGFSAQTEPHLELPAAMTGRELAFAQLPDDAEPFRLAAE